MSKSTSLKKLAVGTLMTGMLVAGQSVLAHTGFKSQALEGTADDNAVAIGHGCEAQDKPVIAQSVVFPTVSPELITSDSSLIGDLGEVIDQGGLNGLVALIQDRSIFLLQGLKKDALSNTIGFYGKLGMLQADLQGRVPFQFTAPNFSSGSCVKQLNVEVAVADICVLSSPTIRANKVNLWIPDNGSQYAIQGAANGVDGVGDPAVLEVKRDLVNNPLDSSCGGGITLTVRPSAADVDANLGLPGWHY